MTPQRFEIGQAITPKIDNRPWITNNPGYGCPPKQGDIYHVTSYWYYKYGRWFIALREMPGKQIYDENEFDPVITTNQLEEALNEISESITI